MIVKIGAKGENLEKMLKKVSLDLSKENIGETIGKLINILKNEVKKGNFNAVKYFVSNEVSKFEEHPLSKVIKGKYDFLFSIATNILPEAFLVPHLNANSAIYFCDINPYQLVTKLLTLLLIYKNETFEGFDEDFQGCMEKIFGTKVKENLQVTLNGRYNVVRKAYSLFRPYLQKRYEEIRKVFLTSTIYLIEGNALKVLPEVIGNKKDIKDKENWLVYFSNVFDYVKRVSVNNLFYEISYSGFTNIKNILRWLNYTGKATYLLVSYKYPNSPLRNLDKNLVCHILPIANVFFFCYRAK